MSKVLPPLYSHHIFIFPFKWDLGDDNQDFTRRTDLNNLQKQLGPSPILSRSHKDLTWKRFEFDWERDYNEAIYFHPYARDVLFDTGTVPNSTVLQYHIVGKKKDLDYRIHCQVKKGGKPLFFNLEIEELTLNFYDTGIGFLAFHLNNYEHNSPDEVLKINDFGRRIYPQFLGREDPRLEDPKGAFLADRIEILIKNKVLLSDDFTKIPDAITKSPATKTINLIPEYLKVLLPHKFTSPNEKNNLSPLLDDRMHVVCWVGDKEWLEQLGSSEHRQEAGLNWHSYIFVDGSVKSGISNHRLALKYNKRHTYKRWADDDLYYGISRYSFVVLANGKSNFHRNVVLNHLQTMYFQIVLLSLLQRGSIVRFSEEIARLSQEVSAGVRLKRTSQAVKALYGKYLEFVNKIYFREVTPQEQGIELYKMVQKNMEIERDVKSLQLEIQDFFHLLEVQSTEQQTAALNTLTIVGSGLLIPSLILAYYGISAFPEISDKAGFTYWWTPVIAFIGMLTGLLAAGAWVLSRGQKSNVRTIIGLILFATIIWVLWIAANAPQWWYH